MAKLNAHLAQPDAFPARWADAGGPVAQMALAEQADQSAVPDGMNLPAEITRREARLEAMAAAKAKIEERAAQKQAEAKKEGNPGENPGTSEEAPKADPPADPKE